ncbi:hypothetical protein EXN22_16590 [Pseudomonas tructae]|uniref:Transmembrane protein n=1 Tax=Pseudomonas tructae TaxID=2518644 RepID=A0A411MK86_9PSED|nr:hypothetical protein [Pseudomonas tructae]QBF27226.1 hypothetical protein EXN22_16590 [Pseudomonas tructae]
MNIRDWGNFAKNAIELVGRHPLVTGILAITGLIGFLFSIYTYEQDRESSVENTRQMERNIEAIDRTGKGVEAISEATFATCAKAPCWALKDFVNKDTIGKPKDLIDAKVAPATRKERGQFVYELEGCGVRVEYTDDAVSYLSANLFKWVESVGEKDKDGLAPGQRRPCNFSLDQLFGLEGRPTPADNANLTVADAMRMVEPPADCSGCNAPELRIASACIDCGNHAEPYLEFMEQGNHAQMFMNSFFMTTFDPVNATGDEGYAIYDTFKETMRANIGADAEFGIEMQDLCAMNIYPEVKRILSRSQVIAVGLGVGPRTWTNALFCKWWE